MKICTKRKLFKLRMFYWKVFRKGLLKNMEESIKEAKHKPSLQEIDMMYSLGWDLNEVRSITDDLLERGFIEQRKLKK